jgi:hypothetical protein
MALVGSTRGIVPRQTAGAKSVYLLLKIICGCTSSAEELPPSLASQNHSCFSTEMKLSHSTDQERKMIMKLRFQCFDPNICPRILLLATRASMFD